MAADYGTTRQSHRGGIRRRPTSDADLSGDRTVVLKRTGRVAINPVTGSGMGQKSPLALPTRGGGLAPVRSAGRGAVARQTGKSA